MTCNSWTCEQCIDGSCPITLEKELIRGAGLVSRILNWSLPARNVTIARRVATIVSSRALRCARIMSRIWRRKMYNFECPVKLGQTVWQIYFGYNNGRCQVASCVVDRIVFIKDDDGYGWRLLEYDYPIGTNDDWMKTVFPTREDAEAALKKMEDK